MNLTIEELRVGSGYRSHHHADRNASVHGIRERNNCLADCSCIEHIFRIGNWKPIHRHAQFSDPFCWSYTPRQLCWININRRAIQLKPQCFVPHPARLVRAFCCPNQRNPPMTYLKKAADIIVQTVRDYPKGTLIVAGVLSFASFLFGALVF